MRSSLRGAWRELKRGRPGRRFQQRYERARHAEPRTGLAKRIALIVVAVIALGAGLFFAVFPGPALPFFFVGGALLAAESRVIARCMDWLELRLRDIATWLKKRWRRLPLAARIASVVLVMGCSATVMYLMYHVVRG